MFFLGKQNVLTLTPLGPGGWAPEEHPVDLTTTPSSGVASVTVYGTNSYRASDQCAVYLEFAHQTLQVYVQANDNQVQELVREQQAPWNKGAIIPTGPTV